MAAPDFTKRTPIVQKESLISNNFTLIVGGVELTAGVPTDVPIEYVNVALGYNGVTRVNPVVTPPEEK